MLLSFTLLRIMLFLASNFLWPCPSLVVRLLPANYHVWHLFRSLVYSYYFSISMFLSPSNSLRLSLLLRVVLFPYKERAAPSTTRPNGHSPICMLEEFLIFFLSLCLDPIINNALYFLWTRAEFWYLLSYFEG